MKAAGTESGETDAFYNTAANQGVPINNQKDAAAAAATAGGSP